MKILRNSFLFLFLLSTSILFAQDQDDSDKEKKAKAIVKADEFYEGKEYYFAIEQYKKAYSKTKDRKEKAENLFRTAECYRHLGDCKVAMNTYKRAYKMKYGSIALLRQADMIRCQGEYEDAIIEYQNYRQEVPDDPRGEEGIASCKMALEYIQNPTRYVVNNMKAINAKGARDYATAYSAKRQDDYGELFFASSREGSSGKGESGITGEFYEDIYHVTAERKKRRGKKKTQGIEEMNFGTPVDLSDMVNTIDAEGAMTLDSRRKTLYFTRCMNIKNEALGCGIWYTKKMGQDWEEAKQIIFTPDSSKSVGDPCLSEDDQIMYFAGNLDGTKGKNDLWMSKFNRRGKTWSEPVNLGSLVNTKGSERFPFVHDDGYLYFSSDGQPGLGGLDIYRIKLNEEGMPTGKVENMGYPINTNADDFAIIFEKGDVAKGYLSSDRGVPGDDDIYSVYLVPLKYTLDGIITSTENGDVIPGVTVTITGTDGSTNTVTSDEKGYYKFETSVFAENTTYKLNIKSKGFYTNEYDATTVGIALDAHEYIPSENIYLHGMKLNMQMDPIIKPIVLPNVLFAVGKWDLTPESMASLDTVVRTLELNPNLVVELRSHTDYTDTKERNQILSQNRADTCVKYLISKGIDSERLVPRGMGEDEPRIIDEEFKTKKYYGYESFDVGTELTEAYIKRQSKTKQDIANQINRRTDVKVLREDYVPGKKPGEEGGTEEKKEEEKPEGEFYTVEARDSFGKIAKKAGITVVDLKKLNGGLRGVRPVPGMILKITKDADYSDFDASHYQAKAGDNYTKVAKATGVDKKTLKELNPDITDKNMATGMYIRFK